MIIIKKISFHVVVVVEATERVTTPAMDEEASVGRCLLMHQIKTKIPSTWEYTYREE